MAKVYTTLKVIERTDTLPITINANGSTLVDYRIYGAAGGGVGDDSGTAYGYVVPISVSDGTTSTIAIVYIGSSPLNANSEYADYVDYKSQKIKRRIKTRIFDGSETFTPNLQYPGIYQLPINDHINNDDSIAYSSNYYTWWQWIRNGAQYGQAPNKSLFAFRNFGIYVKDTDYLTSADFKNHVKELYDAGTPFTATYVTREYYDTDPPVPLPALPTVDGTTIIDYDGTPKPSQMYVKYNSSSGWEPCGEYVRRNGVWVPCTEYVRRNGVWVPQS